MALIATSQQSRFHAETIEDTSGDVDLKGVTVSVGDTELLADAHLHLTAGTRYGLVGRNGVGKSSLLKSVGWGLLVGLPRSLRCLYVDQLEGADLSQTPIEVVVGADVEAQRAQRDAAALQGALESGDPRAMAAALRALRLQRLKDEVTSAHQIAERRSGERGLAARQVLVAAEGRLAEAEAGVGAPMEDEELHAAPQTTQDELNELFERLSLREPEEAEAQARVILTGLGFTQQQQEGPIGQLSGGWLIRVSLAQSLFLQPDLLLLDEPTNHLDLKAIVWLQRYLTRDLEGTTVVVISHDRAFLDAVAQEIVVFKNKQLAYYNGNYEEYVRQREDRQAHQARLAEGIERKKQHMERSIQEGLRQAQRQGDDKKLGMVASRKKKLEWRLGAEKNVKGHRVRVNKDFVGYFESARLQAEVEPPEPLPVWKVPDIQPLRFKGPLLQVEGVSCGYPGTGSSRASKAVLKGVSLCIEQDDRVALVGPNGEGKSTLVKTLLGELPPLGGTLTKHSSARVSYFQQQQVEELRERSGASALSYMQEQWPQVKEQELRNQLGSFGIKGSVATQPLPTLSGGQAVRVALAAAFYSCPHLLVLDEPSNHLDLEGVECMVAALGSYQGAVLLVSHDQYLIQESCKRVFLVAEGGIHFLEGGVAEYVQQLGSGGKKKAAAASAAGPKSGGAAGADKAGSSRAAPKGPKSAAAARAAAGLGRLQRDGKQ